MAAEALADDHLGVRKIEAGVEVGSWCVLDAVIGPKGLGAVGDFDGGEGLGAGMG